MEQKEEIGTAPEKKKNNKVLIIVAVLVLLCCCCVGIVYTGWNYWGDWLYEFIMSMM